MSKIYAIIDNQKYTTDQLERLGFERGKQNLLELIHHGAPVKDKNGRLLSYDDVTYLSYKDTADILLQTKKELGAEGIHKYLAEPIAQSEEFWRKIDHNWRPEDGYDLAETYVILKGINIKKLVDRLKTIKSFDENLILVAHPEHYPFLEKDVGMEVMGLYAGPVDTKMEVDKDGHIADRVHDKKIDHGYFRFGCGTSFLTDGTPRHDVALHKFRIIPGGFEFRLQVWFPKGTPKEMVDGHKLHLAMEFYYGLKGLDL